MRHTIVTTSIAALLTLVPAGAAVQLSARQQSPSPTVQQEHSQMPGAKPNMQDMAKMHQQMMSDMKAADARLDQLVQQMNSASGDAKVNATAAVVTELVRQQKAMHEEMGKMHEHMMGSMMMKQ